MIRRRPTSRERAIAQQRAAKRGDNEGVRPGVASAFGLGLRVEVSLDASGHDVDRCDTFGCPICLDLAERAS
jgi:hypothetical protein